MGLEEDIEWRIRYGGDGTEGKGHGMDDMGREEEEGKGWRR